MDKRALMALIGILILAAVLAVGGYSGLKKIASLDSGKTTKKGGNFVDEIEFSSPQEKQFFDKIINQTGCLDLDNGKDIYQNTLAETRNDEGIITHISSDSCAVKQGGAYIQGSKDCAGENCYVAEGYCREHNGSLIDAIEYIPCAGRCHEGICVEQTRFLY